MATFDIKFESVEVTIGGVEYTVQELNGEDNKAYMELIATKSDIVAEPDPDHPGAVLSKVKMHSFSGLQTPLIGWCLRDTDGKKVPEAVISKWPQRVIKMVHELCQNVCKMGEDETAGEEAAKK